MTRADNSRHLVDAAAERHDSARRRATVAIEHVVGCGEAVTFSSSGPEGNTTNLGEVTIRYTASAREVNVRLAQITGGGSGSRPTFALSPPGPSGAYQASVTWTVIQVFGGEDLQAKRSNPRHRAVP